MREFRAVHFKADLAPDGSFNGRASVYGVVDHQGDIVERGAFRRSLNERGRTRPLLWGHQPDKPIGVVTLSDSLDALHVQGQLVLDTQLGREAHALMKAGAVDGLSIGYEVRDAHPRNGVRHLADLDLWEVSLVTFPANTHARVDAVKDGALASLARTLSAMHDELEGAALRRLLTTMQSVSGDARRIHQRGARQ